jgi:hypothetical protein
MIDVDAYRDQTPRRMTRVGKVARVRPGEIIVFWVDDRLAERVALDDRVPDEFAALPAGAWFQAVAKCHPRTRALLGIESFRRDDSLHVTNAEALEYWDEHIGSPETR